MPRDYKPDKREHYDDRRERDHRMDASPYPPDRRSMKRSREYDQREPKEPYARDERELYDRRDRERRMYKHINQYCLWLDIIFELVFLMNFGGNSDLRRNNPF